MKKVGGTRFVEGLYQALFSFLPCLLEDIKKTVWGCFNTVYIYFVCNIKPFSLIILDKHPKAQATSYCLNEAVEQDMKRVHPEDHDGVYDQNRESFRPPPVLFPTPVGMTTKYEQLQQDGLGGVAQFSEAARMAGTPGYQ